MAGDIEIKLGYKLGYSQHVISIVVLVLTLFTLKLPLSAGDKFLLKLLASILFFVTIIYVTTINFEIINGHLSLIQTQDSYDMKVLSSQIREIALIQIFSLITWLFLYIGVLILLMFILDIWSFIDPMKITFQIGQNLINLKEITHLVIIPLVLLMIVHKYIATPLSEKIGFKIILHPKDELVIGGEDYDEPLVITMKNTGIKKIEIKDLVIEFPERVTLKIDNNEFEKNRLTLEDLKKVGLPTLLIPKKNAQTMKDGKYKIKLEIYSKYNPGPEDRKSKIYDYVLVYVRTDKLGPITKYLDAVITV